MLLGATWSDVFCLPSVGVDVCPSPGLRFEGRSSEHPCRDSCALRTLRVIPINEVTTENIRINRAAQSSCSGLRRAASNHL